MSGDSEISSAECVAALKALAEETRWRIVQALLDEPMGVNDLVERLGISQYNISKHVRILEQADIILKRKEGKSVICSVRDEFRRQLGDSSRLDLGCCSFNFD